MMVKPCFTKMGGSNLDDVPNGKKYRNHFNPLTKYIIHMGVSKN